MAPQIIKNIAKALGYVQIAQFLQDIFRTRFATDMYLAKLNIVTKTHEKTFGEYKNKYNGQEIAIIATGPSLNNYKPIPNVINIGVNKAIFYEKVKLDYYFAQDYSATKSYLKTLQTNNNIVQFYGIIPMHPFGYKRTNYSGSIIPESYILANNAKKYYLYTKSPAKDFGFESDIDKTWIVDTGSVVHSAMQFALFTNPKRIYLVGCDCSSGYFDGTKGSDCRILIDSWKELKRFADIYYPETEIISVNPVGLKGLFTDLYQE